MPGRDGVGAVAGGRGVDDPMEPFRQLLRVLAEADRLLPAAPWRVYPNPMRSDGVFVSQDKPRVPYQGVTHLDGRPIFPAVPQGAWSLGFQLPHQEAADLVQLRNALPGLVAWLRKILTPPEEPWA